MPSPRITAARRKAILTRHRTADDPELALATRDHTALVIEDFVREALADCPPLTDWQRKVISDLITPYSRSSAAEAA